MMVAPIKVQALFANRVSLIPKSVESEHPSQTVGECRGCILNSY
jgi:hypothetical protein